jgi:hypothetical protein
MLDEHSEKISERESEVTFDAVQAHLRSRNPKITPARVAQHRPQADFSDASSRLAVPKRQRRLSGGEGGTLSCRLQKPKKPNEIRLRQRADFCFVATIVYHLVCDGNHQI